LFLWQHYQRQMNLQWSGGTAITWYKPEFYHSLVMTKLLNSPRNESLLETGITLHWTSLLNKMIACKKIFVTDCLHA